MSEDIVVLVDAAGRCFIGEIISTSSDIIVLKDPLYIKELIDKVNNAVHLSMSPVFHTFEVNKKEIRWISKFTPPEQISNEYKNYIQRIKAKRTSNLEIVSSIPSNLKR